MPPSPVLGAAEAPMKGTVSLVPSAAMISEGPSREGLARRLVAAVMKGAGPAQELEITDELTPELMRLAGNPHELLRLVQAMVESQIMLRGHYTRALGRFCVQAMISLSKTRCDQWLGSNACVRLIEGVLLCCMTDAEDRLQLCEAIQVVLRSRLTPRQAECRLQCACMSISEQEVRSLYAPSRPGRLTGSFSPSASAIDADASLRRLVRSLLPTEKTEDLRQRVFDRFDAVIYRRFGVHGRQFGSAVNGFQLQSSDIDISVLLPAEVQARLVAEAQELRERAENGDANVDAEAVLTGLPGVADWRFLSAKQQRKAASVAATRALALELRHADLNVVEVIDAARVPIVKCRHLVQLPVGEGAPNDSGDDEPEVVEYDVDISFCNEVAYFNSRLLRCYANFDDRAKHLGVLVKLWAKRRKINSPFDGTLSSYSYSLMVIHFLQIQGILPNLQIPRLEVLSLIGKDAPDVKILDGGHSVWFLDPDDPLGTGDEGPPEGWPPPPEVWLGSERCDLGLRDLLYGFFRYFAVEFNAYAHVVSIRVSDLRPKKAEYFAALAAEDGELEPEEREAGEAADAAQDQDDREEAETAAGDAVGDAEEDLQMHTPAQSPHHDMPLRDGSGDLEPLPPSVLQTHKGEATDEDDDDEEEAVTFLTPASVEGRRRPTEDDASDIYVEAFDEESAQIDVVADGGKSEEHRETEAEAEAGTDASVAGVLAPRTSATPSRKAEEEATRRKAEAEEEAARIKEEAPFVGTVKTFSEETGFGFIACDATLALFRRDVFLHHRQMKAAAGVTVGDRVRFGVEFNNKGQPQARMVSKVGADDAAEPTPAAATTAAPAAGDGDDVEAAAAIGADTAAQVVETPATEVAAPATAEATPPPPSTVAVTALPVTHGATPVPLNTAPVVAPPIAHGPPLTASYAVQKRVGDRLCLCIDDPMEKNRTLGTSFTGHEMLSRELLRALNILKKGGDRFAEELFKEQDSATPSRRRDAREFSPIPLQSFSRSNQNASHKVRITVQIERPIKKEMVGRIIGTSGNVIKMIRENASLEDARVNEVKGSKESFLILKGSPENVQKAMAHAEHVINGPKQRSRGENASYNMQPKQQQSQARVSSGAEASTTSVAQTPSAAKATAPAAAQVASTAKASPSQAPAATERDAAVPPRGMLTVQPNGSSGPVQVGTYGEARPKGPKTPPHSAQGIAASLRPADFEVGAAGSTAPPPRGNASGQGAVNPPPFPLSPTSVADPRAASSSSALMATSPTRAAGSPIGGPTGPKLSTTPTQSSPVMVTPPKGTVVPPSSSPYSVESRQREAAQRRHREAREAQQEASMRQAPQAHEASWKLPPSQSQAAQERWEASSGAYDHRQIPAQHQSVTTAKAGTVVGTTPAPPSPPHGATGPGGMHDLQKSSSLRTVLGQFTDPHQGAEIGPQTRGAAPAVHNATDFEANLLAAAGPIPYMNEADQEFLVTRGHNAGDLEAELHARAFRREQQQSRHVSDPATKAHMMRAEVKRQAGEARMQAKIERGSQGLASPMATRRSRDTTDPKGGGPAMRSMEELERRFEEKRKTEAKTDASKGSAAPASKEATMSEAGARAAPSSTTPSEQSWRPPSLEYGGAIDSASSDGGGSRRTSLGFLSHRDVERRLIGEGSGGGSVGYHSTAAGAAAAGDYSAEAFATEEPAVRQRKKGNKISSSAALPLPPPPPPPADAGSGGGGKMMQWQ